MYGQDRFAHEDYDFLVARMGWMLVPQQLHHVREEGRTLVCAPGETPAVLIPLQNFVLSLQQHCHFLYLSLLIPLPPCR